MRLSRITTWITWIENIVLAFIIALTFYILIPIQTQHHTISIVWGDSVTKIITQLNKKGYNLTLLDKIILTKLGTLQTGEIRLQKSSLNRIDFLDTLTHAKPPLLKVTLIAGETKEIFFSTIAKQLDINATKLFYFYKQFAPFTEASIAPETYFVPKNINEKKLIQFFLKASQKKYQKLFKHYHISNNKAQQNRMLTIASIIQKEAGNTQEMPLVASVIYNRLKKNMPLQMDGTLNYGLYSHTKVTPQRIKKDTSLFNTYKHKGLPPSPIGSVSINALKSAFEPQKSPYLYFMRDKKGGHNFSQTFKGHRKNIKRVSNR